MLSVLPTFNSLSSAVAEMNENFPRSTFELSIGEEFNLSKHYNEISEWFSNKVGVYVLFNQAHEVIRVGSSTSSLYNRLNTYFDYQDDGHVVGIGWWKEGVSTKYIRVIEVPINCAFEALAIEQFLLDKLCPPLNKEGKLKHLSYRKKMLKELNRLSVVYGWDKVNKNWYTVKDA